MALKFIAACLLVTLGATFACGDDDDAELATNRAKWHAAGLTEYQYQFRLSCFCPFIGQPYTAVVENGEPASLTDSTRAPITPNSDYDLFRRYSSIPNLFEEAEQLINRADEITITYDPQYGYPVEIASQGRLNVADDEITITITNFKVLQ